MSKDKNIQTEEKVVENLLLKEVLGKRISIARKLAHMTQAEFAERINISEKYLSRIECGKQLPSIVIVAKICEVLCISADELLGKTNIYNSKVMISCLLH